MGRLDGKVALVSGGARGIGAAIARRFLDEGATAVVGDILNDDGAALVAELGDRVRYLGRDGIRVNSVHPGVIQTPMTEGMTFDTGHVPLHRMGQPTEIAQLAVYLASEESAFVTVAEFVVDGGETAGTVVPPGS